MLKDVFTGIFGRKIGEWRYEFYCTPPSTFPAVLDALGAVSAENSYRPKRQERVFIMPEGKRAITARYNPESQWLILGSQKLYRFKHGWGYPHEIFLAEIRELLPYT